MSRLFCLKASTVFLFQLGMLSFLDDGSEVILDLVPRWIFCMYGGVCLFLFVVLVFAAAARD